MLQCDACASTTLCLHSCLNEVLRIKAPTIRHLPQAVRVRWTEAFTREVHFFNRRPNLIALTRILFFPKATLAGLSRGGRKKKAHVATVISERLSEWEAGNLDSLWQQTLQRASVKPAQSPIIDPASQWKKQVLTCLQEGAVSKAAKYLQATGIHKAEPMFFG